MPGCIAAIVSPQPPFSSHMDVRWNWHLVLTSSPYCHIRIQTLTLPMAEAREFLGRTLRIRRDEARCDRLTCSLAVWLSLPLHRREFP